MKAWRVYDLGNMILDDVPEPEAKPGWVVVQIKVVQPSVTETIQFKGGATRSVENMRRLLKERGPLGLFGHEYSGVVTQVGDGVNKFKVGDRVASLQAWVPCGECRFCISGKEEACEHRLQIGQHISGAFAEYAAIPVQALIKIPEAVSFHEGAAIQPLTVAVCAVAVAGIQLGDTVVVLGQGAIGLGVMQVARVAGAGRLVTTARRQKTIELSRRLGADNVVNAGERDPVEEVIALTDGQGADVVFDAASGSPSEGLSGLTTFFQSLKIARRGGKVVECSTLVQPVDLNFELFQTRRICLFFRNDITEKLGNYLVQLMASRRVVIEPSISHIVHGLEHVPQAFEITSNKQLYEATNPAQVVI